VRPPKADKPLEHFTGISKIWSTAYLIRVAPADGTGVAGLKIKNDRFNRSYPLIQGWNRIAIDVKDISTAPQTRPMNLSQIQGIRIFAVQLPQPRVIYLECIRLSK